MSAEVGLTEAEKVEREFLWSLIGSPPTEIETAFYRKEVARIKADAIAQERAAWVAKIEALASRWAGLGEGPFAPDAPITLMNAVKAKQLRGLLSSADTEAGR